MVGLGWPVTSTQFKIYTWLHRPLSEGHGVRSGDFLSLSRTIVCFWSSTYIHATDTHTWAQITLFRPSYLRHTQKHTNTHVHLIKQTEWKFVRIVPYLLDRRKTWTLVVIRCKPDITLWHIIFPSPFFSPAPLRIPNELIIGFTRFSIVITPIM